MTDTFQLNKVVFPFTESPNSSTTGGCHYCHEQTSIDEFYKLENKATKAYTWICIRCLANIVDGFPLGNKREKLRIGWWDRLVYWYDKKQKGEI